MSIEFEAYNLIIRIWVSCKITLGDVCTNALAEQYIRSRPQAAARSAVKQIQSKLMSSLLTVHAFTRYEIRNMERA